jgi:23S rRNA pseudouridine2605 synthase
MELRLQKLLAAAGVASRRDAEKLITARRVTVNGHVMSELGTKADPDVDTICVDGQPINLHPEKIYILLNKPRGYTSTREDPHAPRVVIDLVRDIDTHVYPVGRLDVDTEGMLLLTNDGDFAMKVTHPKHKIPKTYRVEARGLVSQEILAILARGIMLEDGFTAPAKTKVIGLNTARQSSTVDITITEGRKRQVRRMFETVGHPVVRLTRTKIGNLTLGKLKPGEWRFLAPEEVDALVNMASQ